MMTGKTPWRNGSASDSRSEGCVFESRRGQQYFFYQSSNIDGMFDGIKSWLANQYPSFLSVVVITSALHAVGRRFEPGRKHVDFE